MASEREGSAVQSDCRVFKTWQLARYEHCGISLGVATKLRSVDQKNDVLFQACQHRHWEIVGLFGAGSDGQDVKIACQSPLSGVEVESVWSYTSPNLPPERVPQGSPRFAVCQNIPCLSLQER